MPDHDLLWAGVIVGQCFTFYLVAQLRERQHRTVLRQMENNLETMQLIVRVAEMQEARDGA